MNKLDKFGIIASILCAIHCAILPILVIFLPTFFLSLFVNEYTEWIFLMVSFFIGIWSLCLGYSKHKSIKSLTLISIGFTVLLTGKLIVHYYNHKTPLYLNLLMVLGGLIIASSHYINNKLCSICVKCKHEN